MPHPVHNRTTRIVVELVGRRQFSLGPPSLGFRAQQAVANCESLQYPGAKRGSWQRLTAWLTIRDATVRTTCPEITP